MVIYWTKPPIEGGKKAPGGDRGQTKQGSLGGDPIRKRSARPSMFIAAQIGRLRVELCWSAGRRHQGGEPARLENG